MHNAGNDTRNFNSICELIPQLPKLKSFGVGFRGYVSKEKQDIYWGVFKDLSSIQNLCFIEDGLKFDPDHAKNFVDYLQLLRLSKLTLRCHSETKYECFKIVMEGISNQQTLTNLTLYLPERYQEEPPEIEKTCYHFKNLSNLTHLKLIFGDRDPSVFLNAIQDHIANMLHLKSLAIICDYAKKGNPAIITQFYETCSKLPNLENFECKVLGTFTDEDVPTNASKATKSQAQIKKKGVLQSNCLRIFQGFDNIREMRINMSFGDEYKTYTALNMLIKKRYLRYLQCETRDISQEIKNHFMQKKYTNCIIKLL